ncbi:MAG: VCBS repeat-containing protein, partial [Xanthomonadales bacterium]|nr:VCBS repeat-containing protein [Xanthomonadales bacterium]
MRLLNSILLTAIVTGTMSSAAWAGDPAWQFEEVSAEIGATWQHRLMFGPIDTRDFWTGGLAAADIDNDGWVDLYIPRGDQFAGLLLRNLGNGQFSEVSQSWNIVVSNGTREASHASGAAFADIDG